MLVLAAVPDLQFQKLRVAVAPKFFVARASTWDDALETIRSRPVEIAFVDPGLSGIASRQEIERLHLLFPSLRLILYTSMTPQLAPVPCELRWVLEDGLRTPGVVQTIQQVAARARVDRGTCARWFARAGLASPRHILAAARVLYAHRLLQDPGFTIEDVAKRLGYAQAKTLQQHARKYLGLTAGEMKLSLTADQATARIVQGFLTPATRAAATAS